MNGPRLSSLSGTFLATWKNLDARQLRLHWASALSALVAFLLTTYNIWLPNGTDRSDLVRTTITVTIGISLFLIPSLIFEESRNAKRRLATLSGLLILSGLFMWFSHYWTDAYYGYKIFQLFLLAHVLVSLTPLVSRIIETRSLSAPQNEAAADQIEKSFWSENWFLLERLHMAFTQSVLLIVGSCAALFSIDKLFQIKVESEVYGTVVAFIAYIISTLLFIGSLGERKEIVEPADILKRLVRTVLTPLAVIYIAILYAYGVKIGLSREWPRGSIAFLVSGLAFIITFSYLIMRPLANSQEFGSWLKKFWNNSFRLLIGPVLLLMLGLGRRVSEYGWTEQRAALGLLALWMLGISLYYWTPNRRSVVGIPVSLAAILFFTWFGPFSPAFIGHHSQEGRLVKLLAKERAKLTFEEKKEVNSVLSYLCGSHGPEAMSQASGVELDRSTLNPGSGEAARRVNCGDGYVASGQVIYALGKLGVEVIGHNQSTKKPDSHYNSRYEANVNFQNAIYSQIDFDLSGEPAPTEDTTWVIRQKGALQLRMHRTTQELEWLAAKDQWVKVDLSKAIDVLYKHRGEPWNETPDLSNEARVLVKHAGRTMEIQFSAVSFDEDQRSKLDRLSIFVLLQPK